MGTYSLRLGAMCDPIHKQLDMTEEQCKIEQRAADSVVYLTVHGFLTDGERDKANRRIVKSLEKKMKDN